jgi:hypothetical protein
MNEINLKPCPFCGAQPEMNDVLHDLWVRCDCGASTSMQCTEERAAKVWNLRIEEDDSYEGTLKITPSNCREVLEKAPRRIIIEVVVKAMEELNKTIEDNTKCVGIIEHFERAYKTRSAQKIHAALAQVFDEKPVKETLQ